jgi:hypothetical protein
MVKLTGAEGRRKRDELVEAGYTVVAGVVGADAGAAAGRPQVPLPGQRRRGVLEACRRLELEHLRSSESVVMLSKSGHGPPLYWHQDCVFWDSPRAATPWPTRMSLAFYLTDTRRENGCLRVIPGTHRRRIDLHDPLPNAHEAEIQAITELPSRPAGGRGPCRRWCAGPIRTPASRGTVRPAATWAWAEPRGCGRKHGWSS